MDFVNPTREQFKTLYGLSAEQPVGMLNLIKFREHAIYPEKERQLWGTITGRNAYELYSKEAESVFQKMGVVQSWIGQPLTTVIGPDAEEWDLAFVATYPSVQAFIDLVKSVEYQNATKHRTAAVLDSRLLACAPLKPSTSFAPSKYFDTK